MFDADGLAGFQRQVSQRPYEATEVAMKGLVGDRRAIDDERGAGRTARRVFSNEIYVG